MGANPARVPSGPKAGQRLLAAEEDEAFALLAMLDPEQRARATIAARTFGNIVSGTDPAASPMAFAGLYSTWAGPNGEEVDTVCIYAHGQHSWGDLPVIDLHGGPLNFLMLGREVLRAWDALLEQSPQPTPFMRHHYLAALHDSGCAVEEAGWSPCFVTLERGGSLAAAAPAYLKTHSYGEYVFDWAWADAYHRNGVEYYPKLLSAIPFTPVTGPRLLAKDDAARLDDLCAYGCAQREELAHWIETAAR